MLRAGGTGCVWLLSCLPIALPSLYPPAEISLATASILGLAALPWIAWAGIPWRDSAERPLATVALALPPLSAALAIDLGRGEALPAALLAALATVAMIGLLGLAASRTSRARLVGASDLAWLALVPGLAMLRVSLEIGGAPTFGRAPGWLAFVAGASPVAWAWRPSASPWPAIAVCAVLAALARVGRSEEAAP